MADAQIIDHLRNVRSLADCSDDELAAISDLMKEVELPPGTPLTKQGDSSQQFIVIADGHATVEIDGQEIAGVMEGSFVGELGLLDRTTRTATVTSVTPLRAYVMDNSAFQTLLERSPTLRAKVERAAEDRRPR